MYNLFTGLLQCIDRKQYCFQQRGSGIMFSRNMTDSIARDNYVSNEDNAIVISESHNNEIYNNTVSNSGSGIDVDEDSFEN